jgi:hypothetical protein
MSPLDAFSDLSIRGLARARIITLSRLPHTRSDASDSAVSASLMELTPNLGDGRDQAAA